MDCVICYESMKATRGGGETNWSQRCIRCVDSWVCGKCYHTWDVSDAPNKDKTTCFEAMPCVICKDRMWYSHLVNMWDEGMGVGWWEDRGLIKYPRLLDIIQTSAPDDEIMP